MPKDLPKLTPEEVKQLIAARTELIQRKVASKNFLRAVSEKTFITYPETTKVDERIMQRFQNSLLILGDALAELPKGHSGGAGSWEVLEDLLGKDIVDGWRK